MATASNSSTQTTRAHSIMTLDGYVSRGKAPPNSVPRDHAILQDFAAYLELRLKCLNMSMLRRIFADFLNEQENTFIPMMQQGCTIITIYPVLRTSAQRLQNAELLLIKPKRPLETRKCVFLYLQCRTATRSMELLKHLFLEFVYQREKTLLEFVERGCHVISVIPFELPRMILAARPPSPPVAQESPRAVDAATEQQHVGSEAVAKTIAKRQKRKAALSGPSAFASTSPTAADDGADVAAPLIVQKRTRGRQRKTKTSTTPLQAAASIAATELAESTLTEQDSEKSLKRKRGAGNLKTGERVEEKSRKRGKSVMSEEMCRSQLELARKMQDFEAQIPWEAVYNNLSPPFDEEKHPVLALKFHKFWLKHSRAVWERKFWAPMSRKLNPAAFNRRSNRQLTARNAFQSLTISAYEELGAEFFVKLDSQKPRHPGWWYREPTVVLFSLQQMKGEDAMWDYVTNEALERFPDCNQPLPLAASNTEAMRVRHKRQCISVDSQPANSGNSA
ncbi:hypothetical protein PI124_g19992 [Phytophthora idaei]|nr:hypothetical protein PI125_g21193 [Phytophthora idaei]KAG3132688.1 hypothetical protein PI126_g19527 [Phytophthora idaei]KAG3234965.1 hypothetical protein PI124_g19992 [Phytophthora idaei]